MEHQSLRSTKFILHANGGSIYVCAYMCAYIDKLIEVYLFSFVQIVLIPQL